MTESAQSEIFRSHMIHLLEEQKYDEALPILNDWSETHPSDREMRMYRLLVLRIRCAALEFITHSHWSSD
jgi:hypothetical protein